MLTFWEKNQVSVFELTRNIVDSRKCNLSNLTGHRLGSQQPKFLSESSWVFRDRPHAYEVTSQPSDNMFFERWRDEQYNKYRLILKNDEVLQTTKQRNQALKS